MSESEFNDYNEIIYERDKLKEQNEKLKEGLEKIQNPVLYLQKQAEASGAKMDGLMAVALSKDCEWLKNIAYETLKSCES